MKDPLLGPVAHAIGEKIGADIYIVAKSWFQRLDPTRKKLKSYRQGIRKAYGSIQIMGMPSPRPLVQIYVGLKALPSGRKWLPLEQPVRVLHESSTSEAARRIATARHASDIQQAIAELGYSRFFGSDPSGVDDVEAPEIKDLPTQRARDLPPKQLHGANALKFVQDHENLVVLGQPGAGKTTFVKYLALAYSGFVPLHRAATPLLPVVVSLRELGRVGKPTSSAKWLEQLAQNCAQDIGGESFNASWLERYLQEKLCLVLLDGVDEVPAAAIPTVLQSIKSFATRYRGNRIIVTCRSASFDFALDGFSICEIGDFNSGDVKSFISQWYDDNSPGKANLLKEIRRSHAVRDLCKTPLLLTMVCVLYQYRRSIPGNRAELYSTCVDALLFRWDAYRGVERTAVVENFSPARKKMVLARIARMTFDKAVYYFKKTELLSMLEYELKRANLHDTEAREVLQEIEHNNGLLVEKAVGIYAFSHTTFHEYFTALEYHEQRLELDLLAKALEDQRYREVLLMCLESMHSADNVIVELSRHVKHRFIDKATPSEYLIHLIDEVLHAEISMDPKLRQLLKVLKKDLVPVSTLEFDGEGANNDSLRELDFNEDRF